MAVYRSLTVTDRVPFPSGASNKTPDSGKAGKDAWFFDPNKAQTSPQKDTGWYIDSLIAQIPPEEREERTEPEPVEESTEPAVPAAMPQHAAIPPCREEPSPAASHVEIPIAVSSLNFAFWLEKASILFILTLRYCSTLPCYPCLCAAYACGLHHRRRRFL